MPIGTPRAPPVLDQRLASTMADRVRENSKWMAELAKLAREGLEEVAGAEPLARIEALTTARGTTLREHGASIFATHLRGRVWWGGPPPGCCVRSVAYVAPEEVAMTLHPHVRSILLAGVSIVSLALAIAACVSGGDPRAGAAPVAVAGDDRSVAIGALVELDGADSNDPGGRDLSFAWAFEDRPGGSGAALSTSTEPTTTFTPDVAGVFVVALTVSNGTRSAVDRVAVTASASSGTDSVSVLPINDQTTRADVPIVVEVKLVADDPDGVTLAATSNDQTLVADADVEALGTGVLRSLRITPAPQGAGTVVITVVATSAGGAQGSTSFALTVTRPFAQFPKLTAPDGDSSAIFGDAVAIDGNVVVIGARGSDVDGFDAGAAYVYVRVGDAWNLNLRLPPSPPVVATEIASIGTAVAAGDRFGSAVAVDGSFVVVGAPGDDDAGTDAGAVYVYERCPRFTTCLQPWSEVAKIVPTGPSGFQAFGAAVAIDGDHLIVGAPFTASSAGSASVYRRVGADWTRIDDVSASDAAPDSFFGASVAISGDHAIVGANAYYSFGVTTDFDGSAYVFQRSGDVWNQVARLREREIESNAFGRSVAIDGEEAIVGDPLYADGEAGAGAAYLFARTDGAWTRTRIQRSNDDAPGRRTDEGFGWSVDVLGDRYIVGAPRAVVSTGRPGSAYVVERIDDVCCFIRQVNSVDSTVNDGFGWSVAMGVDQFVVGAPFDDELGENSGAAYVFSR